MVFIGTAGWSISRDLRGSFPAAESILSAYGRVLNATEINSTFYRRHRVRTFERWRDSVPGSFRFAVKLPRTISHSAALQGCDDELIAFFDDVHGLAEKLGPVLVQLPASVHFDRRGATRFFLKLRRLYSGPVACEPRHASWYGAEATQLFRDQDLARVVADPPRPSQATEPLAASSLLYVRWHGSPRIYWSAYSDAALIALSELIARSAFEKTVWVTFDNTAGGAALEDALRLMTLRVSQGNRG